MVIEWLVALIIAIAPHWGPGDCEEEDTVCVSRNEAKAERVHSIAEAILGGSEREKIDDPVLIASVIARESSFLTEPCERVIPLSKIVSRTPNPNREGQEHIEWSCGSRTCARDAINVSTVGDKLNFWVCSAGELGMMQLHPADRWVRSGMRIPGTDITLPRSPSDRRELVLDPANNIALGCAEMASHREAYVRAHPNDDELIWMDWIGRYNSGRDGNTTYLNRILAQYRVLCNTEIPNTIDGVTTMVPLRDVWEGCAAVDEYLANE